MSRSLCILVLCVFPLLVSCSEKVTPNPVVAPPTPAAPPTQNIIHQVPRLIAPSAIKEKDKNFSSPERKPLGYIKVPLPPIDLPPVTRPPQ